MSRRILLDTQALLWIRMDHPDLTKKARAAYRNERNEVFVSIVSLWEIAIKKSLGKIQLSGSLNAFISSALEFLGLSLLPLTVEHILRLESLPYHHRDPFDRIIVSQALHEKMHILAGDPEFDSYGVKRIW